MKVVVTLFFSLCAMSSHAASTCSDITGTWSGSCTRTMSGPQGQISAETFLIDATLKQNPNNCDEFELGNLTPEVLSVKIGLVVSESKVKNEIWSYHTRGARLWTDGGHDNDRLAFRISGVGTHDTTFPMSSDRIVKLQFETDSSGKRKLVMDSNSKLDLRGDWIETTTSCADLNLKP